MLASVPAAKLGTASALTNFDVAATGATVVLVKVTAFPPGFTMKIVANQEMEHVVVSSFLVSLGTPLTESELTHRAIPFHS